MPTETFSTHSPTFRSFPCSVPVLLCPLQWSRPTKTLESVSCSSCGRIFSFTAPGSYYTTTYFLCLFIVLSVLESKPMPQPQTAPGFALPPTLQALPEQSLCYCKALSHDSFTGSHSALCRRSSSSLLGETQVQTAGCTCFSHGPNLKPKAQEVCLTNHFRLS